MSGVNKVILVGRLGTDPEVRSTPTGAQVCTLSIATSETWVKDGKREEKTEWHRVVLWGRQAELAQKYLKKGRMVYVEGKMQTRSWQDPQGQKRYMTEIVANNLQFIDGGGSAGNRDNQDGMGSMEEPQGSNYYQSQNTGGYEHPQQNQDPFQGSQSVDNDIPF
ncbi:MAG: single-stranded DNA-binding protein [Bdellovibrionota bacterium]